MYKFLSRPQKQKTFLRPLSGGALVLFTALSVVSPAQIQRSDSRVFSNGLKIEMDHTTPPYAALEDAYLGDFDKSTIDPTPTLPVHTVQLKLNGNPLSVREVAKEAPKELRGVAAMVMPGAVVPTTLMNSQTIPLAINRDELLQALFLPIVNSTQESAKEVETTPLPVGEQGTVIIGGIIAPSAKAKSSYAASAPSSYGASAPSSIAAAPLSGFPPALLVGSVASPIKQVAKVLHPALQTEALQQSVPRLITGTLDLAEGLALSNPTDQIEIFHEVEGESQGEPATVWLRDGRYRIEVGNLEGSLIAELRTAQGEILGRGELDLVDLPLSKVQQYRVQNISLQMKPVIPGISGHVISAYSYDEKKTPVAEAPVYVQAMPAQVNSDAAGLFSHSQIASGSSAFIEAQHSGYWSSLSFATTDGENMATLYPKKMLKAFAEFVTSTRPGTVINANSGIIWGRVLTGSQPVAGAQVELLTSTNSLRAIYFNGLMLPDPRLKGTSANGYYAFVPVESGAQVVQATAGDQHSEPLVLATAPMHVATVNIQMKSTRRVRIKAFDALRVTQPLASKIVRYGDTGVMSTDENGSGLVRYASGSTMMVLEADAGAPYIPERFVSDRKQTYLYMPMIRKDWLAKLRSYAANEVEGGSAVGFIQGTATYSVRLEPGCDGQVVYFDASGEYMHQAAQGVPGGGFAIFGLHSGLWTVMISDEGSLDQTFATTILADLDMTSVISHSMR